MIQAKSPATISDLHQAGQKAELVNGEIVLMSPASAGHGRVSGKIFQSLLKHEERTGHGYAFPDNVGFVVDLPQRQSFSPDAAYFLGPIDEQEFVDGPPTFAAEVRSPADFGPMAEQGMAAKRADYFAAGTLVVWDVDMIREKVIRVYRSTSQNEPTVYMRNDTAEAEPAVPGWTMAVATLLR